MPPAAAESTGLCISPSSHSRARRAPRRSVRGPAESCQRLCARRIVEASPIGALELRLVSQASARRTQPAYQAPREGGYIERFESPTDGRAAVVECSGAGRLAYANSDPPTTNSWQPSWSTGLPRAEPFGGTDGTTRFRSAIGREASQTEVPLGHWLKASSTDSREWPPCRTERSIKCGSERSPTPIPAAVFDAPLSRQPTSGADSHR